MATTLADLQNAIALDFDQSSSAPDVNTDDYARRTLLINRAEKKWKNVLGGKWNDLLTTITVSVTSGVSTVSLPSDFSPEGLLGSKGGNININGYYYEFVKVSDLGSYDSNDHIAYVTGDETNGYYINIQPTPSSSYTFTVRYYSKYIAMDASLSGQDYLLVATDITKIPDPDYIVLEVVSQLFKVDGDGALGTDYENQAKESLNQMIARNNMGNIGNVSEVQLGADINEYPVIGE